MNHRWMIAPEPFVHHENEALSFEARSAPPTPNRTSAAYIRWVQSALNQIIGLRLAADGIPGPMTRAAIRDFQQRQRLTVDGIVGPRTEASLRATLLGASGRSSISNTTARIAGGPSQGRAGPTTQSAPCRAVDASTVQCDQPQFASRRSPTSTMPNGQINRLGLAPDQRDILLCDYDINDHRLKPAHQRALSDLLQFMSEDFLQRRTGRWIVSIAGRASHTGSEVHNDRLSELRAACVERFMRFHLGDHIRSVDQIDFFGRVDFNPCFEGFQGSPPGREDDKSRAVRVSVHRPGKSPPPVTIFPSCRFSPTRHGFKFDNSFTLPPAIGRVLSSPPVSTILSRFGVSVGAGAFGLCGGMVSLARDHFEFGVAIPSTTIAPVAPTRLFNQLVSRQMDSLNLAIRHIGRDFAAPIFRFARVMSLPNTGSGSVAEESLPQFGLVRATLARGSLCLLGLVLAPAGGALTDNHQVLARCLTQRGTNKFAIHIYDPNFHDCNGVTLEIDLVGCEAHVVEVVPVCPSSPRARRIPVRGFFLIPYRRVAP